jgi:hypothetical protein
MTLTHEIYSDLIEESKRDRDKVQISKRCLLENGQEIIFAVSCEDEYRYLYFEISDQDTDIIPKCKGMNIGSVKLKEYNEKHLFCEIAQAQFSEAYIYETIIEDIRKRIVSSNKNTFDIVVDVFKKWQNFFAKNKEILLSEERQQGLYGELLFLDRLIENSGTDAVFNWSGCKYETHDFYINGNAVEIKTTSKKAPYRMHISSEYQLDDNDVTGMLLVHFYALRKSESDGERLDDVIQRIRRCIGSNPHALTRFEESLEKYGYFDSVSNKYATGYLRREEHMFKIEDGFPRITVRDLTLGLSNCTYDVLVEECFKFIVPFTEVIENIVKGNDKNE